MGTSQLLGGILMGLAGGTAKQREEAQKLESARAAAMGQFVLDHLVDKLPPEKQAEGLQYGFQLLSGQLPTKKAGEPLAHLLHTITVQRKQPDLTVKPQPMQMPSLPASALQPPPDLTAGGGQKVGPGPSSMAKAVGSLPPMPVPVGPFAPPPAFMVPGEQPMKVPGVTYPEQVPALQYAQELDAAAKAKAAADADMARYKAMAAEKQMEQEQNIQLLEQYGVELTPQQAALIAIDPSAASQLLKPPPAQTGAIIEKEIVGPDGKPVIAGINELTGETLWTKPLAEKPATTTAPRTVNVGGRIKQWNPDSGRYDIDVGPAPATANQITLDPNAVDMAAQFYATTGQMPALGMGSAAIRQQIMNRAGQMFSGQNLAQNKAVYSANQAALTQLQKQSEAVGAFENTALKNLDMFLSTAQNVVDSGSPWINMPLRAVAKGGLGSKDLAAYNAARQVALTEIARVVANPNLVGVLSDTARREVEGLIPQDATLAQVYSVAQVLKSDMANRKQALAEQTSDLRQRIGSVGGTTAIPIPPAGLGTVNMRTPDGKTWKVPSDKVEAAKSRGAVVIQ